MAKAPTRTGLWLMKTEPDVFSLQDLAAAPKQTTFWDGVRNYQARNFMRDAMAPGDGVLFYHSRVAPMAVVGTAVVAGPAAFDPSQFDPESHYFDAKSLRATPRWYGIPIAYQTTFAQPVTLAKMRQVASLADMLLLQKGSRLSIQPVAPQHWRTIIGLGRGL
jgi:predicted RNA-binding protein with PUA-like domain